LENVDGKFIFNEMHQKTEKFSIPKEYRGNFDDFLPLDLTEKEKSVLIDIHEKSKLHNVEYGASIVNGKTYTYTSNKYDGVLPPDDVLELIESSPPKSVTEFHTHTNLTPFSRKDYTYLLKKSIDKIVIIVYNGDTYVAKVENGHVPTKSEYDDKVRQIRNEVIRDIKEESYSQNWTLDEYEYMIIREQAYRIARAFKWELQGGNIYG